MDSLLSTLNFEQLGVTGILIVFVFYIYLDERKDRKMWQDRAFTTSRETQAQVSDALKTLDAALEFVKGS